MAMEPQSPASSEPEVADSDLAQELEVEHGLMRAIIIGVLVATPVCIAVWMGLIALAVSAAGAALAGPLAMAAGIGVLTGLLFGAWAGFVSKTHTFEELDRLGNARRRSAGSPREKV
jgi:hypothetical protein